MPRSRNIKPGFFANDELADCRPLARLLFIGLWTIADRNGVLEDKPRKIKAQVLPYDECDIEQLLIELINAGFLLRFQIEGRAYLHIENFKRHQNPHKKEDSRFPEPLSEQAPDKSDAGTRQAPDKSDTSPADSCNLKPDSCNLKPERGLLKSGANPGQPSNLFSVIPERWRSREFEDAVSDWASKRSDNGRLIGLDEITLKNQLLVHQNQSAEALLMMVQAAAGGGWKNLRVLDRQSSQEPMYANLDGVAS